MNNHSIPLHGPSEFESMRRAGQLASDVLDYLTPFVKPKITTGYLDSLAHDFIISKGATISSIIAGTNKKPGTPKPSIHSMVPS